MIDFEHVWLPQIVSYARLISSGQLENEWLGRAEAATSVTNPDELYEAGVRRSGCRRHLGSKV